MKKIYYEIKWALQRLFRGWDDRAAMDISEWLAQVLPEMLEYIIKYSKSYPVDSPIEDSEEYKKEIEEWENTLQAIADGFREYSFENAGREMIDENYRMDKFHKGMELFVKHYNDLWM